MRNDFIGRVADQRVARVAHVHRQAAVRLPTRHQRDRRANRRTRQRSRHPVGVDELATLTLQRFLGRVDVLLGRTDLTDARADARVSGGQQAFQAAKRVQVHASHDGVGKVANRRAQRDVRLQQVRGKRVLDDLLLGRERRLKRGKVTGRGASRRVVRNDLRDGAHDHRANHDGAGRTDQVTHDLLPLRLVLRTTGDPRLLYDAFGINGIGHEAPPAGIARVLVCLCRRHVLAPLLSPNLAGASASSTKAGAY